MTSNTGYDDAFLFWRKETYIVEVEIGEGWNTVMMRPGTTWKMLLNEQQR